MKIFKKHTFFYSNPNYMPEPENKQLSLSVVVPVYNALDELKLLVSSIEKSHFSPTTEIIFIDDCSPDKEVKNYLKTLSDKYTVIYNQENLGFIKTANKGFEIAHNDIVVILNEDTQIPDIFEENIIRCFESDKNIALASPVSSHSGWFTIPTIASRLNATAQLLNKISKHTYPPFTPEGFCFCCRRDILQKIGMLDTIFGKGYCEEDDLVMRAIVNGYRTVLIDDLLVMHKRHASFTSEKRKILYEHNKIIFTERWENLLGIVREEMSCRESVTRIISAFSKAQRDNYRTELENWWLRVKKSPLNLDDPQTFNEKIQWLKLYDSTPIKTRLADKYLVRDWVKEKIGEQYLIPLLGVYDKFDDIDFDKLPNQFVMKCNHGSGWNIIVKNKSQLDIKEAKQKMDKWMSENFAFHFGYELHYRDIEPKIVIEKYMDDGTGDLRDYKFMCFNGQPEIIWIDQDRHTEHKRNLYNLDWKLLPYKINTKYKTFPSSEKPKNLEEMIRLSKILSESFPVVRVDFYLIENQIYFGEITFTSSSSIGDIEPATFEKHMSDLIILPQLAYNIDTGEYYKLPKVSKIQKISRKCFSYIRRYVDASTSKQKVKVRILGLKITFKKPKHLFLKKTKYKENKRITRYLGGIVKKVKSPTSKKFYLWGLQLWNKKRHS